MFPEAVAPPRGMKRPTCIPQTSPARWLRSPQKPMKKSQTFSDIAVKCHNNSHQKAQNGHQASHVSLEISFCQASLPYSKPMKGSQTISGIAIKDHSNSLKKHRLGTGYHMFSLKLASAIAS